MANYSKLKKYLSDKYGTRQYKIKDGEVHAKINDKWGLVGSVGHVVFFAGL